MSYGNGLEDDSDEVGKDRSNLEAKLQSLYQKAGKWAFVNPEDVEEMDIEQLKEALAERGLSVCM
jgi:hypothetical protein